METNLNSRHQLPTTIDSTYILQKLPKASSVRGIASQHRRVVPESKILFANTLASYQVRIKMFRQYSALISDCASEIAQLEGLLSKELQLVEDNEGYLTSLEAFDPIRYLKRNSLRVHLYIHYFGPAKLCHPRRDLDLLVPYLNEWHQYVWYLEHVHLLGEEIFLEKVLPFQKLLPELKVGNLFFIGDQLILKHHMEVEDMKVESAL